ncbi:MAG: hypothetical protein AAGB51_06120 [Planctomycetota bacterium]
MEEESKTNTADPYVEVGRLKIDAPYSQAEIQALSSVIECGGEMDVFAVLDDPAAESDPEFYVAAVRSGFLSMPHWDSDAERLVFSVTAYGHSVYEALAEGGK